MKRPITTLKQILKYENYTELEKHPFNDSLYRFNLIGDLYYDLIQALKANNFEIFRVKLNLEESIKVTVKVINHDN